MRTGPASSGEGFTEAGGARARTSAAPWAKAGPVGGAALGPWGGGLGRVYAPAGVESAVVACLRIGTRAPTALMQGPMNVALVIDPSGSMEGQGIEDARAARLAMVDSLSNHDKLAVI